MKTLVNTTICYIQKEDKVLMLHRTKKENDYNHDKWIGIGGKFENCESPQDCVIREVKEETGLELLHEDLEYCGIVTFVDLKEGKSLSPGLNPQAVLDTPLSNGGKHNQINAPVTPQFSENSYTEFMHVFRVRKFSGELKNDCDEGELEWVEISKMNELPHWEGDEIFLKLVFSNSPFFSLKLIYKNSVLIQSVLN